MGLPSGRWLHRSGPYSLINKKQNKSPLPRMLIRLALKQRGHSSVRPLPPPCARRTVAPFPSLHHRPRHTPSHLRRSPASQSPASLAPSPYVHRPSPLGVPLTPPWLMGRTCRGVSSGLPPSSHGHSRAWSVLVVLAHRRSLLDPTPMTGIDRHRRSPPLRCKCIF
jgi:hypothetical protein